MAGFKTVVGPWWLRLSSPPVVPGSLDFVYVYQAMIGVSDPDATIGLGHPKAWIATSTPTAWIVV